MGYNEYGIKEIVEKIARNDVYLPAIQRKFVWDCEQIESLYDSIMRGYPIGTFLFWFVAGEERNNYTFYKFIQEYHERDNYRNEVAPNPELKEEIIGILDGQQRLSSMYIALQGTYAYKKPWARWDNDSAFPRRKFYLNLLKQDIARDEDNFLYEFRFLTDEEARRLDENHLWFSVRNVLLWGKDPKIDDYYDSLLERNDFSDEIKEVLKRKRELIKKTLRILHQRLVIEELISYYKVDEQDLDKILDIFVRVNSGGTVLSKSDLLFSTIVANWERARDEIETLLETINKKGEGFYFNNDFIMRTCLVLTDSPVLFKVRSFKKESINRLMKEWGSIKTSIECTVDLLVEYGFSGENLTSQNAVIPIAYHLMKGGFVDNTSKNNIRKYLINSLLKQTFGGQGDQVLSSIRGALRREEGGVWMLRQRGFDFQNLVDSVELPSNKTLKITEEDVEDVLEYRKGAYSFMVLSLLYPNLKLGQVKFHQDHIHPASLFTDTKLREYGINEAKWEKWRRLKDELPNLQLMEGVENVNKSKTPFKKWLYGNDADGNPNVLDIDKFLDDNHIPKKDASHKDISLEFEDFEVFFSERKEELKKKLLKILL